MSMKVICPLVLCLCASMLVAQNAPPNNPSGAPVRRGGMTPCWQQAGIEKSVMEQRWSIERDTHSQVQAICSNSSLSPQQKREQVRDIRQQAHQKMEGLITPEQEKALTSCQQQRGMNHPNAGAGGGAHAGGGDGCGEWQHGGPQNGGPGGSIGGSNPPPSKE